MNCVVLGLGSNRSYDGLDPVSLLRRAVVELEKIASDVVISSVYRTKAMYVEDQDDFYNMVLAGYVDDGMTPHELLECIHKIEGFLGRDRSKEVRFGPRSVDIDIEFFGDLEIDDPDLQIPHPRLKERAFVLQPLLEILPKCADAMKGEKLKKIEKMTVSSPDVQLYLDSKSFFLSKVDEEVQNGNRDTDTRSS